MENIYVYSQKILQKEFLGLFIIAEPISLLGKLRKFLLFSNDIECADNKGCINYKSNTATTHFIIFGNNKKQTLERLVWFCNNQNIFLLNLIDKNELAQRESIFFVKNKKTRSYISSLYDEYLVQKANKNVRNMAFCIQKAEEIISGKIKIN